MASPTLSPAMISKILAEPAATPPPGVTPNFQNPPNHQAEGRAWMIVGLIIMLLPLLMRLHTQWFISKAYLLEDFLIIVATAFSISLFACEFVGLSPGHTSGFHMWDVTVGEVYSSQRLVNINEILYNPAVTFVKLAILFQIHRVFVARRSTNFWLWLGCWAGIILTPLFYFIVMFIDIFQCWPREKIWMPFTPGHCINFAASNFLATGIFNVVSDVLILILPLPTIYKLHMNIKKKLLVGGIFATGGLACIVSALRLYYSYISLDRPDSTWNDLPVGVTAFFEDAIGTVVFCLPVAPKFLQALRRTFTRASEDPLPDSDRAGPTYQSHKSFKVPRHRGTDSSLGVSSIGQYMGAKSSESGGASDLGRLEQGPDTGSSFSRGGDSVSMDMLPRSEDKVSVTSMVK